MKGRCQTPRRGRRSRPRVIEEVDAGQNLPQRWSHPRQLRNNHSSPRKAPARPLPCSVAPHFRQAKTLKVDCRLRYRSASAGDSWRAPSAPSSICRRLSGLTRPFLPDRWNSRNSSASGVRATATGSPGRRSRGSAKGLLAEVVHGVAEEIALLPSVSQATAVAVASVGRWEIVTADGRVRVGHAADPRVCAGPRCPRAHDFGGGDRGRDPALGQI